MRLTQICKHYIIHLTLNLLQPPTATSTFEMHTGCSPCMVRRFSLSYCLSHTFTRSLEGINHNSYRDHSSASEQSLVLIFHILGFQTWRNGSGNMNKVNGSGNRNNTVHPVNHTLDLLYCSVIAQQNLTDLYLKLQHRRMLLSVAIVTEAPYL